MDPTTNVTKFDPYPEAAAELERFFGGIDAEIGLKGQSYDGSGASVFDQAASSRLHMQMRDERHRAAVTARTLIELTLAEVGHETRRILALGCTPRRWHWHDDRRIKSGERFVPPSNGEEKLRRKFHYGSSQSICLLSLAVEVVAGPPIGDDTARDARKAARDAVIAAGPCKIAVKVVEDPAERRHRRGRFRITVAGQTADIRASREAADDARVEIAAALERARRRAGPGGVFGEPRAEAHPDGAAAEWVYGWPAPIDVLQHLSKVAHKNENEGVLNDARKAAGAVFVPALRAYELERIRRNERVAESIVEVQEMRDIAHRLEDAGLMRLAVTVEAMSGRIGRRVDVDASGVIRETDKCKPAGIIYRDALRMLLVARRADPRARATRRVAALQGPVGYSR